MTQIVITVTLDSEEQVRSVGRTMKGIRKDLESAVLGVLSSSHPRSRINAGELDYEVTVDYEIAVE